MSDVNWGSDHLEPPKKRRIPLWILGCGGGCMFLIGAVVVAAMLLGPRAKRWVESLNDPAVQWPELAVELPHDEPPQGFHISRMPFPLDMLKIWTLDSSTEDLQVFVVATEKSENDGVGDWISKPEDSPFFAGQDAKFHVTEGKLFVQGRELRSVRFERVSSKSSKPSTDVDSPEAGASSPEGEAREGEIAPPDAPVAPVAPDAPDAPSAEPEDPVESEWPALRRRTHGQGTLRIESTLTTDGGNGLAIDVTSEGSPRRVVIWMVRTSAQGTVSDQDAIDFLSTFYIGPRRG